MDSGFNIIAGRTTTDNTRSKIVNVARIAALFSFFANKSSGIKSAKAKKMPPGNHPEVLSMVLVMFGSVALKSSYMA